MSAVITLAEPSERTYACSSCGSHYANLQSAEARPCAGCGSLANGHDICGHCAESCQWCDSRCCYRCLEVVDYGDGKVRLCIACRAEAVKTIRACDSCHRPRTDVYDVEDRDDAVGYHEIEYICRECRGLRDLRAFVTEMQERGV